MDNDILQRFDALKDNMNKRFDAEDKRFNAIDNKFDKVNDKFCDLKKETNDRFYDLKKETNDKFCEMRKEIISLNNRLTTVEVSVEYMLNKKKSPTWWQGAIISGIVLSATLIIIDLVFNVGIF